MIVESGTMRSHAIYLDKRGSNLDNNWTCYRITSEGEEGDPIELCMVRWPTFEDIDEIVSPDSAVVVNLGDTGYTSAYDNFVKVLKKKWNIDHDDDKLIGVIWGK